MLALASCSSPPPKTTGANSPLAREPAPGFFERLADQVTERECNVIRFTCPYGLGPAGEPCECADGRGYVFRGRTVKR